MYIFINIQVGGKSSMNLRPRYETSRNNKFAIRCVKQTIELAVSLRDKLQQRIGLEIVLSHAFVSVRVFVHTCISMSTWKHNICGPFSGKCL